MNDSTSASRCNNLLRRILKKSVISLYCRGWLPMRAVQAVFRCLDLDGV